MKLTPSLINHSRRSLLLIAAASLLLVTALSACGSNNSSTPGPAKEIRLGYFPNLTHASAIVADKQGLFAKELGSTTVSVKTFNAGPTAMEALRSGAIDASYVGPGPATNAFINSNGQAITIVAGAANGGAALVVDPSITTAAQLKGKKIATPQLGNTQDIALRYWLKQQGLTSTLQGGGDVSITPQENAQIFDSFNQHLIAGAWVPEPHATKLVKAGGHVLVDEHSLWPNAAFPTTVLAVRNDFLRDHPETIKSLLKAQLDAEKRIASDPATAQANVAEVIGSVTGKPLAPEVIAAAWPHLEFTHNPVASAITEGANHAYDVGILTKKPDLTGLVKLDLLNQVLSADGQPTVS